MLRNLAENEDEIQKMYEIMIEQEERSNIDLIKLKVTVQLKSEALLGKKIMSIPYVLFLIFDSIFLLIVFFTILF